MRKIRGYRGLSSGISALGEVGLGRTGGVGELGLSQAQVWRKGLFLEVFGDVFSKVFFTFHQPNLQLALCVSKANSRLP